MVEKIRALCKEKGISIFALEKQLGFGNGVIRRWDTSAPSYERVSAVADALGVTVAELTDEDTPEHVDEAALKLIERIKKASPEELRSISDYIDFIESKR